MLTKLPSLLDLRGVEGAAWNCDWINMGSVRPDKGSKPCDWVCSETAWVEGPCWANRECLT